MSRALEKCFVAFTTKKKVEIPDQIILLSKQVLRAECIKSTIPLGTKKKLVVGIIRRSLEMDDHSFWRHTQQ